MASDQSDEDTIDDLETTVRKLKSRCDTLEEQVSKMALALRQLHNPGDPSYKDEKTFCTKMTDRINALK